MRCAMAWLKPRFTLRALLLITALATAFSWWYVRPKRGTITEAQASRITNGMTKRELISLLGYPLEREDALASEKIWQRVAKASASE